jgi:RNA polymerase sigma factor (sigma-70 family)
MIETLTQPDTIYSDQDLLEDFLSGDSEAFEQLVSRHGAMVFGVALRVTCDYHEAEDVCQAVFLVLARKAKRLKRCRCLAAWLHHVARQMALDVRKSAGRRSARLAKAAQANADEAEPACPERSVELTELRQVVDEELDRLPRQYRDAFLLHHVEGLTQAEAAGLMGCAPGTVSWWLSRARRLLRKRLARRGLSATAVALVAAMSEPVASAAVAGVSATTVSAAAATLSGGLTAASGLLSAQSLTLAKGVVNGMWAANLKAITAAVATVTAVTVGITLANVDRFGDPLPKGAVSRLGTVRWQHPGRIEALDWSPNGKYLATAARFGNSVYVWDAETGKSVFHEQFGNMARSVRFSANNEYLAACGTDGTARVWRVSDWKRVAMIKGMPRATRVSISSDGKKLACAYGGHNGRFARIYDVETGKKIMELRDPHPDAKKDRNFCPYGVAISPDGKLAGTVAVRASHLWDLETGKVLGTFPGQQKGKLDFSPDGKWMAYTTRGYCDMILVDVEKREVAAKRSALMGQYGPQPYHCIRFSPDGQFLAAGNLGGQAAIWKMQDGEMPVSMEPVVVSAGDAYIGGVGFSPNAEQMVTGSWDGSLRFWDPETGEELNTLSPARSPVRSIAWGLSGKTVATGHAGGEVVVWDTQGKPEVSLPGSAPVVGVALSQDGRRLAAARQGGGLDAWDLDRADKSWMQTSLGRGAPAEIDFFVPTGEILALDAANGAQLVDPETGAIRPLERHCAAFNKANAQGLTMSADRSVAAARPITAEVKEQARNGGSEIIAAQPIVIWELATGREIGRVTIEHSAMRLAISNSGRYLAVTFPRGGTTIIDVSDGQEVRRMRTGFCNQLVFSQDDTMLATVDEPVRVWRVSTGREVYTCRGQSGKGSAAAFSPSGAKLATGDSSNAALIWDLTEARPSEDVGTEPIDRDKFDALVAKLSSRDAGEAYRAMWKLQRHGAATVEMLTPEQLAGYGEISDDSVEDAAKQIEEDVEALEAARFATRKAAYERLESLMSSPPAIRAKLRAKLERFAAVSESVAAVQQAKALLAALGEAAPLSTEALRVVRTARLLERIGTPEAQDRLKLLTEGEPDAWPTLMAKACLKRMQAATPST